MKTFFTLLTAVLVVAAGFATTGCERQTAPPRTEVEEKEDSKITEQVKAALDDSPSFKFPDVQVSTYRGNVQLSGFVLTDEQKRSAEDLAKTIPGVVEVENRISIKQ